MLAVCAHGQGGMDEAHQYYRIEQSAHWDLRLPSKKTASTGPRGPFYPPTYQPPPNDQRVRDAVNAADQERLRAEEAKRNFEAATGEVRQRLQEDNQLKDALREQLENNKKLREQLEQTHRRQSVAVSELVFDRCAKAMGQQCWWPCRVAMARSTAGPIALAHRSKTSSETATDWPSVGSVPAVRATSYCFPVARATRP